MQHFGPVDYSGTFFMHTDQGQDYTGFVFSYQSNRRFYVVVWRHKNYNYGGTAYRGGIKGAQLKVFIIVSFLVYWKSFTSALKCFELSNCIFTCLWHNLSSSLVCLSVCLSGCLGVCLSVCVFKDVL